MSVITEAPISTRQWLYFKRKKTWRRPHAANCSLKDIIWSKSNLQINLFHWKYIGNDDFIQWYSHAPRSLWFLWLSAPRSVWRPLLKQVSYMQYGYSNVCVCNMEMAILLSFEIIVKQYIPKFVSITNASMRQLLLVLKRFFSSRASKIRRMENVG